MSCCCSSVNGQYVNQGKLGAAVLANHNESEVCVLKIHLLVDL